MSRKSVQLPTPTPKLLRAYVAEFDKTQAVVEGALTKLFQHLPANTALDEVLVKVVTLNDLYHTGIFGTYRVAEHIHLRRIDPLLRAGDPAAVARIATVRFGTKTRTNYSFATKYCAWHQPEAYPIYDGFVDDMLWGYKKHDQFAQCFSGRTSGTIPASR